MLINQPELFRAIDKIIADTIAQAHEHRAVMPVREAADAIVSMSGCGWSYRQDIIHRLCIRCISRGIAVEFRDTFSPSAAK